MKLIFGFCGLTCLVIFVYELSWLGRSTLAPILLGLSGALAIVCFYLATKEK